VSLRTRGLVTLAALAVALLSAVAARAEIVVRQDTAGRAITFDVLAPEANVGWYAGILSAAAHGDEISRVTVRIVAPADIAARCGADAAACYERRGGVSTITVPVGQSSSLASIVLHEYGHHLDAGWAVEGVSELNGTPAWWAARGMAGLVQAGTATFDYSLGWSHSVGEVFAEDYAFIHSGGYYSIPWLAPPDEALRAAMLAELGVVIPPAAQIAPAPAPPAAPEPPTPPPAEPEPRPVVASRSGLLAPRGRAGIRFRLLGADRRVTVAAAVSPVRRGRAAARVEIVCGRTIVRRVDLRRSTTIEVPSLGPGMCRASIVNAGTARQRYSLRLRLSLSA
jgi:hypothetical protein